MKLLFEVSHPGRHGSEAIEADNSAAAVRGFRQKFGKIQSNHPYTVTGETGEPEALSADAAYNAEQVEDANARKAAQDRAKEAEAKRVAKVNADKIVADKKVVDAAEKKIDAAIAQRAAKDKAEKKAVRDKAAKDKAEKEAAEKDAAAMKAEKSEPVKKPA